MLLSGFQLYAETGGCPVLVSYFNFTHKSRISLLGKTKTLQKMYKLKHEDILCKLLEVNIESLNLLFWILEIS